MLAALTAIVVISELEEPLPFRLLVIAGSIYVIARRRANIQRPLAGTEPRIGSRLESRELVADLKARSESDSVIHPNQVCDGIRRSRV